MTAGRPRCERGRSTINRILDELELLAENPTRRPRSSWRRFACARPGDCYQIDGAVVAPRGGHRIHISPASRRRCASNSLANRSACRSSLLICQFAGSVCPIDIGYLTLDLSGLIVLSLRVLLDLFGRPYGTLDGVPAEA
nr:hypothetical protein [Saccharopolyspora pogona]